MADVSRRDFLKLSASGAASALTIGNKTVDRLIPYLNPPQQAEPGVWTVYATTCRECPAGCGMHLRHREGRIIKAEANPDHPVSRGGLCPRGQSAPQGQYDPDRIRQPLVQNARGKFVKGNFVPASWDPVLAQLADRLKNSPDRVAVLSDLQTGTLADLMHEFARTFGSDRVLFYEPFNYEPLRRAHQILFGKAIVPFYRLDDCDLILSFGADFLETWVSNVQFAHGFTKTHADRPASPGRFVYVGPRLSMTAANADEMILVSPEALRLLPWVLLASVIKNGWAKQNIDSLRPVLEKIDIQSVMKHAHLTSEQINTLAQKFIQAKAAVALAGPVGANTQGALDLALGTALLNYAAGKVGRTLDFDRPHALSKTATHAQLDNFLNSLSGDDVLFIHNTNPVYHLPDVQNRLTQAGTIVYMGTMLDETAEISHTILPIDYPLESWGDYEPWAGLHELIQPTMRRLFDTRSTGDILLTLAKLAQKPISGPQTFYERLRSRWNDLRTHLVAGQDIDTFWTSALRSGGVWPQTLPHGNPPKFKLEGVKPPSPVSASDKSFELWAWPNIMLYDGRVANRGWLQENPEPISCLVWGSCLDVHPKRALALGLKNGQIVIAATPAGRVEVPVRITEDVAESVAALAFGQGHTALGRLAKNRGANAFTLLPKPQSAQVFGHLTIEKTGKTVQPVYMYPTQEQYHRDILLWTADQPSAESHITMPLPEGYSPNRDVYPPHEYKNHRWAMVIDLHRCIGCGACAVACYAENSVPVVGEAPVQKGREMAWLKIVPYRREDDPKRIGFLPMLCQHCDAAPCEPVCPVYAAVHNDEGLNNQVYNRCIGTRYCSNNCPYKVRRFNWSNIPWPEPLHLQLNPDVTVRSRGVMEKCTFCIQRIREVEVLAKKEDRPVRDGEIVPACVQTCPTQTYIFGDLLDPNSRVSKIFRSDPRRYQVLHELNTKPAIVYLKRILPESST